MAMGAQPSPTRPSSVRYVDRDCHNDYDDNHGHDDDYDDDSTCDVYDWDGGILHDGKYYGDHDDDHDDVGGDAHYGSDGGALTPGSRSFEEQRRRRVETVQFEGSRQRGRGLLQGEDVDLQKLILVLGTNMSTRPIGHINVSVCCRVLV